MTLAEFRRVYPTAAFTVSSGKLFTYRYYQNPQAKATLVLLTGGIGLSDLFYKHFARFARDFSVLTFDYQLQFGDNGEFADAVAELLRHLKEKVWLVGQSLGGVVAQVIASRHPEVVEGLVLSNTCSLSGNMSKAGYQDLMKIIESQRKFKKWLAFLPFPLIKRMMRWAVMKKKTDGFTAQEKAAMEELCGAMMELLTKPYEQHMIDFLCDAEHYFGMTRNDFAPWEGRVLLILSEDDTTFTPACREDLIALMPSPTVVTDLTGGHLALMVRLEQYADLVDEICQGVFLQSSVQFALTSSKKNAIIMSLSIMMLLFRRRGVKTWPIGIIPWMMGSFRLLIRNFLLTAFRKPLCTRSPKKPVLLRGQSTQDTRIKTRCLPVCFRIFLRRCRFSLLPSRKNTKKQSAARSRMISSAP